MHKEAEKYLSLKRKLIVLEYESNEGWILKDGLCSHIIQIVRQS
jgi:hypothetical protein